jgi:hypothetical protein
MALGTLKRHRRVLAGLLVMTSVFGLRHELQILDAAVPLVFIDVVNNLVTL